MFKIRTKNNINIYQFYQKKKKIFKCCVVYYEN